MCILCTLQYSQLDGSRQILKKTLKQQAVKVSNIKIITILKLKIVHDTSCTLKQ